MILKPLSSYHAAVIITERFISRRFLLHERDDQLAFCPILPILALAFADNAFKVIPKPEHLYKLTVPTEKGCVKLNWKEEWRARPIFRRVKNDDISPTLPYTYQLLSCHLRGLGMQAGFENVLNSYCFRRASANAMDRK